MRKISFLIAMILLIGCSSNKPDINQVVSDGVNKVNNAPLSPSNNHSKKLFSYYLPYDIGVVESNNISSIVKYDNNEIFLSINVSDVMRNGDKPEVKFNEELYFSDNFDLKMRDQELPANLLIEQLKADSYIIYFEVDDVFLVSQVNYANLKYTLERIVYIGRSLEVDKKLIVSEFSNKETLTYKKEVIELFSNSIPEEGMIQDIIVNEEGGE